MEKSFLKSGATELNTLIDRETGEILDQNIKQHRYLANTKEEFLLLYSSVLGIFERLEQSEIRVYSYLLRHANGVKFDISKNLRLDMARVTNLNERTVYKTCKTLTEKKLIIKNNGLYQVNPRYAFKGSTSERNQALKLILEIDCPDC